MKTNCIFTSRKNEDFYVFYSGDGFIYFSVTDNGKFFRTKSIPIASKRIAYRAYPLTKEDVQKLFDSIKEV